MTTVTVCRFVSLEHFHEIKFSGFSGISHPLLSPLQSLMLQIAANWIVQEKKDIVVSKETYMAEQCPAPSLNEDQATLMVRSLLFSLSAFSSIHLYLSASISNKLA